MNLLRWFTIAVAVVNAAVVTALAGVSALMVVASMPLAHAVVFIIIAWLMTVFIVTALATMNFLGGYQ